MAERDDATRKTNGRSQPDRDDDSRRAHDAEHDDEDVRRAQEAEHEETSDEEDFEAEVERLRKQAAELQRLKPNYDRLLKQRKRDQERIKRWQDLGLDPDEIKERLADKEETETEEAKKTGDTERLLKQRDEKAAREREQWEAERKTLRHQIERLTVDHQLKAALQAVKVDSDLMDGAFALYRPVMRLVEDEGEFRVVARVDDDEMDIHDYIKSEAETNSKFQRYLSAPVNTGAGAGGAAAAASQRGVGYVRKPRSKMTTAEKSAFIAKHGQEAYMKLPLE